MRPIWTGGISFGLIYIPVKMYSATEPIELDLDYLSKKDYAPIRYARINTATGKEVPWKDVVRGYQFKEGDYVVLTEEDIDRVAFKKSNAIEIEYFVDRKEVDPKFFEKPYYLEPDKKAAKIYALLRDALKKSGKIGIAEFVMRNRENLCAIEPDGDVLVLNRMRYPEELRSIKELELPTGESLNTKKELVLATELIDKMSEKFNAKDFKDDYIDELKKLIKAKAHHRKIPIHTKAKDPKATEVNELMSQLKKSLELGGKD